jgi:Uma2 family endonuclease
MPMTARDLEALPEADRGELIRGCMRPQPPADFATWVVAGRMLGHVGVFATKTGLGIAGPRGGFLLATDPDTVLAPDVAFIPWDRFPPKGQRRGFQPVVPDLVVEVLSPSNAAAQVNEKVRIYLAAGVRLVWVVDPVAEVVTVYEPDGTARLLRPGEALDGGAMLPGFVLPLADLFA